MEILPGKVTLLDTQVRTIVFAVFVVLQPHRRASAAGRLSTGPMITKIRTS